MVGIATGLHETPPLVVSSSVPPSPAAQPTDSSTKRTAWRAAEVPDVTANHESPAVSVLTMVPPAPTANATSLEAMTTASSRGAPGMTVSDHDPPLFWLRQILPLSLTTNTLKPRETTPRSVWAPSVWLVQLRPRSKER